MQPNQRVSSISLSATLALDARAKELAAEGRDIVNLTAGEPDFDSPESVRTAAKKSIDSGMVRYTPASGRPTLRDAVAEHLSETRGVPFTREQVTITHSCKHVISGTLLALIEEGDEILVPLPAWVSYFDIIKYAGGVPVGVKPTPECAPRHSAPSARWLVSPRTLALPTRSVASPTTSLRTCDRRWRSLSMPSVYRVRAPPVRLSPLSGTRRVECSWRHWKR